MPLTLARQTLEYVTFPLASSVVDPSTLSHEVAIVGTTSQPSGWVPGDYVDDEVQVLVRASPDAPAGGVITLSVGRWRIWWRAAANPEFPVRQVGILNVV